MYGPALPFGYTDDSYALSGFGTCPDMGTVAGIDTFD